MNPSIVIYKGVWRHFAQTSNADISMTTEPIWKFLDVLKRYEFILCDKLVSGTFP